MKTIETLNDVYPINDRDLLLKLVKEKVTKEMEEEIRQFDKIYKKINLLSPRKKYFNKFDSFVLKNIIYQQIIQSETDDYKFFNLIGMCMYDFPTKTFNLMLDESVNILDTIYFNGIKITSTLDNAQKLNLDFLPIINELIIMDKWDKK